MPGQRLDGVYGTIIERPGYNDAEQEVKEPVGIAEQRAYNSPDDRADRLHDEQGHAQVAYDELEEGQSDDDDTADPTEDSFELSYANVSDEAIETEGRVEISDVQDARQAFDSKEAAER